MASILLLDDEPILRDMLAEELENEGHSVRQSADGLPAFDLKIISSVDLMITDLFMPGIDGLNAILTARKDRPDLKIIAMSGGATYLKQDFLPHTQHFGVSAILRKPFSTKEFMKTVEEVLVESLSEKPEPYERMAASG